MIGLGRKVRCHSEDVDSLYTNWLCSGAGEFDYLGAGPALLFICTAAKEAAPAFLPLESWAPRTPASRVSRACGRTTSRGKIPSQPSARMLSFRTPRKLGRPSP